MHTTTLRKVGGSVMLALPPAILDLLNLHAGVTIGVEVEGDRLVLRTKPKPKYTVEELLAQCDPEAPLSDEDQRWIEMPAVGREL